MITRECFIPKSDLISGNLHLLQDSLFFDIETTGFSSETNRIYLIGCAHVRDHCVVLTQWMTQEREEEKQLLSAFWDRAGSFHSLTCFNGIQFDVPFVEARSKKHGLSRDFSTFQLIDLYKLIKPYRDVLALSSMKQKALETFLGIPRQDEKDGGELIRTYKKYETDGEAEAERLLLLHNRDDVMGMLSLTSILSYPALFEVPPGEATYQLKDQRDLNGTPGKELILTLPLRLPLPKPLSFGKEFAYLRGEGQTARLRITLYSGELKYFFDNHADYYYLPLEDQAIHKSVATYVDKAYRKKATPSTAYAKKSGLFLPLPAGMTRSDPTFRKEHSDKRRYLELTEDFLANPENIRLYLSHVLPFLIEKGSSSPISEGSVVGNLLRTAEEQYASGS